MECGTYGKYRNEGCRCIPCTDANTAYGHHRRSIRGLLGVHGPRAPRHGTRTEYVKHGCRCEACTEAERVYRKQYRAGYRVGKMEPGDWGAFYD